MEDAGEIFDTKLISLFMFFLPSVIIMTCRLHCGHRNTCCLIIICKVTNQSRMLKVECFAKIYNLSFSEVVFYNEREKIICMY